MHVFTFKCMLVWESMMVCAEESELRSVSGSDVSEMQCYKWLNESAFSLGSWIGKCHALPCLLSGSLAILWGNKLFGCHYVRWFQFHHHEKKFLWGVVTFSYAFKGSMILHVNTTVNFLLIVYKTCPLHHLYSYLLLYVGGGILCLL